MECLIVLAMVEGHILLYRGHWDGSAVDHRRNGLSPAEDEGVLALDAQLHLLVAAPVRVRRHKSVHAHVLLLHGRDGERSVSTHVEGGVCDDALVVVVPGEKWRGVAGDGNVEDHILTLADLQVRGKVVDHGFIVGY